VSRPRESAGIPLSSLERLGADRMLGIVGKKRLGQELSLEMVHPWDG